MAKPMRAALLALVLSLGMAAPTLAGPLQDGVAAAQRGDYATALQLWRPLAVHGNDAAQFDLGLMYDHGRGVPQNDAEAAKWYRLAAAQGNADAQNNLGVMYAHGRGVPQNDAAAVKWYRLAAAQGVAQAQFNLGQMYENGQGVPQNYVTAHEWFNLAAVHFPPADTARRDRAVHARHLVAAKMNPAQIAEAQHLAGSLPPSAPARSAVPYYHVHRYCRHIAATAGGSEEIFAMCFQQEQAAYDRLKRAWNSMPASIGRYCTKMARLVGGSYEILETCVDSESRAAGGNGSLQFKR